MVCIPARTDPIGIAACTCSPNVTISGLLAPSTVVPALLKALAGSNTHVRGQAIRALQKIGPAARDAVPALVSAADDKDVFIDFKGRKVILTEDGKVYYYHVETRVTTWTRPKEMDQAFQSRPTPTVIDLTPEEMQLNLHFLSQRNAPITRGLKLSRHGIP